MTTNSDIQILAFYGWWQFAVCLFAFAGLLAIWYHIGKKQQDIGQVWLALSLLCWSLSGGLDVYYASWQVDNLPTSNFYLEGGRSVLSLLNSLFILLALPWFRYLPPLLQGVIKSDYWKLIVGLPFVFSLLPTLSKIISGQTTQLVSELDVYYAFLTLGVLGYVLWESFNKRRLGGLAYLSVVCILITIVAQLLKFQALNFYALLFSAIFKTSLIMIFFALALSWVKDLSEHLIVDISAVFLQFQRSKLENGRYENKVIVKGIPDASSKEILLSAAHYNLLLKFAKRKKEADTWLEIKPKSDIYGAQYDIKDYNEIKRLLNALLDGLIGKHLWTKNLHEQPLKATLFEVSARKIRLAIPADNLDF